MTRIAVTGASGFVGRHLIPLLLDDGHEVRGMARHVSSAEFGHTTSRISFSAGDVRDDDSVKSLIDGCDAVIHLASTFSAEDGFYRIIVEGTERVLAAARDAGVKRLIFLSCLGADATSESPFYEAKWRAEALVRGSTVGNVILRPSLVLGRDDGIVNPLADVIRSLPAIPIAGNGHQRVQPIDVDDLALCIRMALTNDALEGESVSIGGPLYITPRQLVDLVSAELGVSKPKLLVPYRLLPVVARLLPSTARHLYSGPRLSQFRSGVVTSPGIVERTFGFRPANSLEKLGEYLSGYVRPHA